MLTLNVVFTTGTAARLWPLTRSLLCDPAVRLRLIGNGTDASDRAVFAEAAASDRVEHWDLGETDPIEHGLALNRVFERFTEPEFAIADSDVVADGPFLDELWPAPGCAAVFSAPPVWVTEREATVRPGSTFLGGRQRRLADGTVVGNTYLAIYDRAALEPLWRRAPRGFGEHDRWMLDRDRQRALAERGWRFRLLDTTRLLNLELLAAGRRLENRPGHRLHHIGGFSAAGFERERESPRWLGARALEILRSGQPRRGQRIADAVVHRAYLARNRRRGWHRRMNARRRLVTGYVGEVIAALQAGEPPPEQPKTDSPEVDRRVAALVAALRDQQLGAPRPGPRGSPGSPRADAR